MSLDAQKMAVFAAECMENLESLFPESAELGEIMVIAEVKNLKTADFDPDVEEDGDGDTEYTTVRFACTDPRFWVHVGLLRAALETVE